MKNIKKETKETVINVGKFILGSVGAVGLISMAVLAPNAVQCLEMFWGKNKRKYSSKYYIKRTMRRLESRGLIEIKNRYEQEFVRLTEKGRKELLKYQMREKVIEKPRKWDKKWRVVIFDIEERARNLREGLRIELTNLGFIRLQNSVWVHPYECNEAIAMIKTYFKIEANVLYMTVDEIEDDEWLKQQFDLS